MQTSLFIVLLVVASVGVFAQEREPFTVRALHSTLRVGTPVLSPNGNFVVYTLRTWNAETNTTTFSLERMQVNGSATAAQPLTQPKEGFSDTSPVFTADSSMVLFLSTRASGDAAQLFSIPLFGSESDIQQVSTYPIDIDNVKMAPNGEFFIFSANVYPSCLTLQCTADRVATRYTGGVIFDQLYVRHWDSYETGQRMHLFKQDMTMVDGNVRLVGEASDLMPGVQANSPVPPFGDTSQFDISPDSRELAYNAEMFTTSVAWTTGWKIFTLSLTDASATAVLITNSSARCQNPTYSPDGKYIAYLAASVPGDESDRMQILLHDRQAQSAASITAQADISFGSILWTPQSTGIIAEAEDKGYKRLFIVDIASSKVTVLIANGTNSGAVITNTNIVLLSRDFYISPAEIWQFDLNSPYNTIKKRTYYTYQHLAKYHMAWPESFTYVGAEGAVIQGWFFRPIGFNPEKNYPVAHIVHGGPATSFMDGWSYRWNPQIFASSGYVVVLLNIHGSTGFGQAFTDSVIGQWGGYPFEDILKGMNYFLGVYTFADANRVCALGASYGGYMMNWINAKMENRYRCLVNHDGVFDTLSSESATDELWSGETEFQGTPYAVPDNYNRWNPRVWVAQMKTPMLIIHGGKDYRLDITEGLSTFTALQRRGIPSKLLYFPKENHWCLYPPNSILWYDTVIDWLNQWTAKQE